MVEKDIKQDLEKALSLIRQDNTLDALFHLDRIASKTEAPVFLSSYGLCIALERGKVKDAIDLCIKAINIDSNNPYHYLNLGKVYMKQEKKAVAIDIFRKGLRHDVENEDTREINDILDHLGTRQRPVFPFLKRENALNRYVGFVLKKLHLR